jgi:hypothetical protein
MQHGIITAIWLRSMSHNQVELTIEMWRLVRWITLNYL